MANSRPRLAAVKSNPELPVKRPRGRPRGSGALGIVDMVHVAFARMHRIAAVIGAVFGGWVPFAIYFVAHNEVDLSGDVTLHDYLALALVVGGLAYSALTVAQWARMALGSRVKAVGFTVLTEGVMVLSRQGWLAAVGLVLLIAINAIASAVQLARTSRQWSTVWSESESEDES